MRPAAPLRLLQVAAFASSFDRVMIAPLIVVIADDLGVSVTAVTAAVTVHFLGYGLMQVVWAMLADRFGRIRVIRLTLLVAGAGCLAGACVTSVPMLVATRAIAGATFAAAIPGSMIYIGDVVPIAVRQGALTDLMRGTALGTATATIGAGVIADVLSWRAAFALIGVVAVTLAGFLTGLSEPQTTRTAAVRGSLALIARNRLALLVLALAFGEGCVMLAVLNFAPIRLQETVGVSAGVAGAAVATYGLAILLTTPVVKRLSGSWSRTAMVAVGGGLAVGALASFCAPGIAAVAAGAFLLGAGWAFMHSTLQTWATEVIPAARSAVVALFAGLLFTGSAIGTHAGGLLLAGPGFQTLFMAFLGAGIVLVGAAVVTARCPPLPRSWTGPWRSSWH